MMAQEAKSLAWFVDYQNNMLMCQEGPETHLFKRRSPCSLSIATMGTTKDLSFAKCPHLDKGDQYMTTNVDDFMLNLNNLQNKKCSDADVNHHFSTFVPYVKKIHYLLGFSTPTICCYQEIKQQECIITVYFVMQGLDSFVRLEDFMGHHFNLAIFVHNTSVCDVVDNDNQVQISNKECN